MSKKDKTKKPKSRFGAFFGGSFFGFVLCLALIVGTCCFAYFKVSPNWINKTFKTEIDLGEEINNKTISDFVGVVLGISQNTDTYTLNDLNKDFGVTIKDELLGINISDLKDVALKDLPEAVENKFGTISADELKNVSGMDLEANMGKVLSQENIYYLNTEDEKLYKEYDGTTYSNEVTFKYELIKENEKITKVVTKGHETDIETNNEVYIQLWYLPLSVALGDFTSNMGDQITLYELEDSFGVKLPEMFNNVDKQNTTVNEIGEAINKLYVADIFGYTRDTTTSPGETIIKDKDGNTITGVVATLSKLTIEGLEDGINALTLADVFTEAELSTGALSLIPSSTQLTAVTTTLNERFKTLTLGELIDSKVIVLDTATQASYAAKKEKYVAGTSTLVKDLILTDLISLSLTSIPTSDTPTT